MSAGAGWWTRLWGGGSPGLSPRCRLSPAYWEATTNVRKMLRYVGRDRRKARLLAVAWLRRSDHLLADPRSVAAVDVAERLADGPVDRAERTALRDAAAAAARELVTDPQLVRRAGGWPAVVAAHDAIRLLDRKFADLTWFGCVGRINTRLGAADPPAEDAERRAAVAAEKAAVAPLVRCVYPNPFRRPPPFPDGWRTTAVAALADAIYRDKAFDRLAVLADALEEAGCDDPELLAHARADTAHVRGCRAVDVALGR